MGLLSGSGGLVSFAKSRKNTCYYHCPKVRLQLPKTSTFWIIQERTKTTATLRQVYSDQRLSTFTQSQGVQADFPKQLLCGLEKPLIHILAEIIRLIPLSCGYSKCEALALSSGLLAVT